MEGGRERKKNQSAFHKVFISLPFVKRLGQTQLGGFLHQEKGQVNKYMRLCVCGLIQLCKPVYTTERFERERVVLLPVG